MKIKYPYDILIIGVISSWFLGFLISCFEVLITRNVDNLLWFLMVADILILLRKYELDKFEDQASLTWVEPSFLMLNWLTIGMGLTGFLITFSQYWLAKEIRYFRTYPNNW